MQMRDEGKYEEKSRVSRSVYHRLKRRNNDLDIERRHRATNVVENTRRTRLRRSEMLKHERGERNTKTPTTPNATTEKNNTLRVLATED